MRVRETIIKTCWLGGALALFAGCAPAYVMNPLLADEPLEPSVVVSQPASVAAAGKARKERGKSRKKSSTPPPARFGASRQAGSANAE